MFGPQKKEEVDIQVNNGAEGCVLNKSLNTRSSCTGTQGNTDDVFHPQFNPRGSCATSRNEIAIAKEQMRRAWKIIDLDACAGIGQELTGKYSEAYIEY